MRAIRWTTTLILCVLLAASVPAAAAIKLPSLITDHMVLQQGKPISIWGTAEPGERVTVTLGKRHDKAKAGDDGKWHVKLRSLKAGGPYELTVAGASETLTVADVMIGEVWVCSGQSNMQMAVRSCINAEQEIAEANYPGIRLFSVPLTVAGEPQESCGGAWALCSPETVPGFSAAGYFFGRKLHQELDVPIGLINSSWGGTPAESWTTRETLEGNELYAPILERSDKADADYPANKANYDKAIEEWKKAAEAAKAEGKPAPQQPGVPRGPNHPWRAAGLFNAMIAPLTNYPIAGAIWYQGESNAGRAYQYRDLFRDMIKDWRRAWDVGPLSFYFVQLANFKAQLPEPGDSDWAELREAQTMTLSLKHTGMAVIIDIGDAADIHPKDKQNVGLRLALNALAKDYGRDVTYSGPMYKSKRVKGNEIRLKFAHTDGGLVAAASPEGDKTLRGFAVAGEDKRWVWADARIEGRTVIVSSPLVENPVAARYAWADNPACNLYNGEGLPASPFRTDDWPGVTAEAR
ncbi:MAG: sialate O-acetylesterase [Candidatus Hydrogenedentes bacterium]|nr:sialate O-acetylesterase [Candidatus Hydrogenedentota bacterium]